MRAPWRRPRHRRHRHPRCWPAPLGEAFALCDEELAIIVDHHRNA